jgi:hypothetical protein
MKVLFMIVRVYFVLMAHIMALAHWAVWGWLM